MTQKVPRVSRGDVLRVIRRDYPDADLDAVLAILDEFGTESWHRERDRVHIAVLKLASGSGSELRRQIELAKRDYRDALAQAEYPESLTRPVSLGPPPAHEQAKMDESDWDQYVSWLVRP